MSDAMMKPLGGGFYWANRLRFVKPGLYVWAFKRNIRLLPIPKRLPHLFLCIDFGWFGCRTALLYQRFEDMTFEYIRLDVYAGKRQAEFNLYAPNRR